jgi:uncharacterized protein (TIGR00251 family)
MAASQGAIDRHGGFSVLTVLAGIIDQKVSSLAVPYIVLQGAVRLHVRVMPRARADSVDGLGEDAQGRAVLRVRIAAPATEGAANAALIAFLAKQTGLAKGAVEIVAGESARWKTLVLYGEPAAIAARLESLLSRAG